MSPSAILETSGATLEAGGGTSVPLTVRNDHDVVDEYRFQVVGPLARWATVEPSTVSVYPGHSATVTVSFRVPRSCEALAGKAPYGVQVLPAQHPGDTVVAEGTVDVQPFYEMTAEMVPRTSEGKRGGRHRVAVDNAGNLPITVHLVPKDPDARLRLGLSSPTLRIAPGTAQSADLQVRPLRTIWSGTQSAHPFTVQVEPDGGPGTVLAGTHRQNPVLPGWSPKLLKYLVVLALLAALILTVIAFVVRPVLDFGRQCIDGVLDGDPAVCLGADPQQAQGGAGQQEQGGGGQGGGAAGGDPEEVADELTARAPAGEEDQDVFIAEENGTVITRLVLSSSEGDTGVFNLTVDGNPLTENLALEQFSAQDQAFDVSVPMGAGQQLALNLGCTGADDEALRRTDACEMNVELEGVVVPPGD